MIKADIRNLYLQKRQELGRKQTENLSKDISEQFFKFLPEEIFTVHIYLPIPEKNEIDTWPIIHQLWSKGLNTVVPVMDLKDTTISSWALKPDTIIEQNIWGVPEPLTADFVNNTVTDLVVLPLLAFDKKGFRVGYGKGYYDKFLGSFEEQPLKVGLSFFEPIDKIDYLNEGDVPMDYCITPSQIFQF